MIKASAAPGTLKTKPHEGRFPLNLEVVSRSGQVMWTNVVADPSIKHLEYEDPDHPGEIKDKIIQLNDIEFTIRAPVLPQAHRMNFYRLRPPAGTNAPAANQSGENKPSASRQVLGTITLPEETK